MIYLFTFGFFPIEGKLNEIQGYDLSSVLFTTVSPDNSSAWHKKVLKE